MTITNEQAMQEVLTQKNKAPSQSDSVRNFEEGVTYGMAYAYWRAEIISFAQYQLLTDTKEQVPA